MAIHFRICGSLCDNSGKAPNLRQNLDMSAPDMSLKVVPVYGQPGDFNAEEMVQLVKQKFGAWRPAAGQPAEVPSIPTTPLAPESYAGARHTSPFKRWSMAITIWRLHTLLKAFVTLLRQWKHIYLFYSACLKAHACCNNVSHD